MRHAQELHQEPRPVAPRIREPQTDRIAPRQRAWKWQPAAAGVIAVSTVEQRAQTRCQSG